jgi:hypothetical protein
MAGAGLVSTVHGEAAWRTSVDSVLCEVFWSAHGSTRHWNGNRGPAGPCGRAVTPTSVTLQLPLVKLREL